MYGKPIIFSPSGTGKEENQGYDAFVPLIDSGISVYIWSNAKFLSEVIYTCKGLDINYGLELMVDGSRINRAMESFPNAYQIFTKDPVSVVVLRIWNIGKIEQRINNGYVIRRKMVNTKIPLAYYEPAQRLERILSQ